MNYWLTFISLTNPVVFLAEEDSSQNLDYYNRIQEEIRKLEGMAADTAEMGQIKRINYSVNEIDGRNIRVYRT